MLWNIESNPILLDVPTCEAPDEDTAWNIANERAQAASEVYGTEISITAVVVAGDSPAMQRAIVGDRISRTKAQIVALTQQLRRDVATLDELGQVA